MYPPLLRKQQDSVLLTDRRRLFPLTLPPRHRGRPLYPFLSPLPWDKEARTLQLLVPTVTVERPQLFAVSADTQIWTRQIPVSVNKSWCLPLECLHGPAACPRRAHLRGKEAACSPVGWLALAMLPIPQYPPQPFLHWSYTSDRASLAILPPPPKRQCKDT